MGALPMFTSLEILAPARILAPFSNIYPILNQFSAFELIVETISPPIEWNFSNSTCRILGFPIPIVKRLSI